MRWQPEEFAKRRPFLEQRRTLIQAVRGWFEGQGFYEVQTPVLQVTPVMDAHILALKTDLRGVDKQYERTLYLHTSPEFAMKKLLVAGLEAIYQICPVFRDGEGSRLHSPEFTMLEWYRTGAGYHDIMEDCVNLLRHCAQALGISHYWHRDTECDPFAPWQKISVTEAFRHYADIDLSAYLDDTAGFQTAINKVGIRIAPDDRWDDLFFRVMAEKIEPHLGAGVPTILYDYPLCMASLARRKPEDPRFAERFELYVCGVELGNAFSELTDAAEQKRRFIEEMALKQEMYGESYPIDEDFIAALEYGLSESGGISIGLDRLVMLAVGAEDIKQVLWS